MHHCPVRLGLIVSGVILSEDCVCKLETLGCHKDWRLCTAGRTSTPLQEPIVTQVLPGDGV